ncbi:MAG: hypothetical protein KDJ15_07815 [Alphaproteobacteria bacterium]|nr:hypothetical protein [Alphaproteobacteria bacterium]
MECWIVDERGTPQTLITLSASVFQKGTALPDYYIRTPQPAGMKNPVWNFKTKKWKEKR